MSDILMTNTFFMITAIASVLLTIVLVVMLIYLIQLIKKITQIANIIERETLKVADDVNQVRHAVHENITLVKNAAHATFLPSIIKKLFNKKNYEKTNNKSKND